MGVTDLASTPRLSTSLFCGQKYFQTAKSILSAAMREMLYPSFSQLTNSVQEEKKVFLYAL